MKLEADLHIHTTASGHAYSSVGEIIKAAGQKGLKMVAFTDHGPALPGAASLMHFWNLRVLPRRLEDIIVLKGVEANIIDLEGNIDIPDELIKELDIVLAGFHPYCDYNGVTVKENTRTLIRAIEGGRIDIIVHPGNISYPIDIEEVVKTAHGHNVLLEINNSTFLPTTARKGSYDVCRRIAEVCLESGADIVLGSDAHLALAVGDFTEALKLVEDVGFTPDRIVNHKAERVLRFLKQRAKEIR